jgi:hypothetical protein
MPLQKTQVKMMELADAKMTKMLTDPAGGSPTYDATSVDIGGILKITVSPKAETKKLPGDGKTLDTYTRITEVELDCEASLLSFDAYKLLIGGSVADSGTTPNQKATWSLTSATATPPWIKIEGQWLYAGDGLGDAHFILYKVNVLIRPRLIWLMHLGILEELNLKQLLLQLVELLEVGMILFLTKLRMLLNKKMAAYIAALFFSCILFHTEV